MVDYILARLDRDYDPIVAAVGAIKNSFTVDDLFSRISAFNQRMEMLGDGPVGFRSSANAIYRGRGQYRPRGAVSKETGGTAVVITVTAPPLLPLAAAAAVAINNAHDNNYSSHNSKNGDYPECQICYKHHPGDARACWHRYDEDHEEKKSNIVTNSYGIDTD